MIPFVRRLLPSAVLYAAASGAWAAPPPPSACQVQQFAELPVVTTRGQPVVEVKLDGEPRRMLADTGAFSSMLWREALGSLKLRTGNSIGHAGGIGGFTDVYDITVPRMTVGPTEFRDQHFYVVASGGGDDKDAGLFGADFLGQADVQFDLPGRAIRLVKAVRCKGEEEVFWPGAFSDAPMQTEAGSPRFMTTVRINGHPITALIDTGASASVIAPGAAQRVGVTFKASDQMARGIGPASVPVSIGRMEAFSFGDETIKNTVIRVAEVFKNATWSETGTRLGEFRVSPDMILGADFFRSHKVLLARSQSRVFFSYVGGAVFDVSSPSRQPEPAPAAASRATAKGG